MMHDINAEDTEEEYRNKEKYFKRMTEAELVSAMTEEISRGIGGNVSSDNDSDITIPLDYYFGRLPGLSKVRSKDKNASSFVSQDVMDGVESTIAEIMPAFDSRELGYFIPEDDEDVDQVADESAIVNYLFMEEFDGYTMIQTSLKDCLLHRNCTVKAYWDERKEVEYETFEDIPELALGQILTPEKEDQEIEVIEQYITEEADPEAQVMAEQAMQNPEQAIQLATQNPESAQQLVESAQDKFSLKVKRITTVGRIVLKVVAPEQIIVAGDHYEPSLYKARFSAHELIETKSSLIAQGFDPEIVNTLSEYNADIDNLSRGREPEEYDYTSAHESTKLIRVFECYPYIDFDGDGIAELRKVVISNNKLLSNEEWDSNPLIGGVTTQMAHKYKGISLYDRLKDIQDAKTPIMRAIIDGTQLSSNPRVGLMPGVNVDDFLSSRTGGVVRMDTANGVVQIPNPEIPQSSYQFLEHMDGIRRDRGGGAIDTASFVKGMDNAAQGTVGSVMSSMELTNSMLATTFAETLLRGIFIQVHHLIKNNIKTEVKANFNGKWTTSFPSEWKKRTSVKINVGTSISERARKAMAMKEVVAIQKELALSGSPLYSEIKLYRAITDSIQLSGIKSPERYITDPESDDGQQAAQQAAQSNQEQQAKEDAIQGQMVEAQNKLAEAEQMKGMADLQNAQIKAQNEGLKNQITALKNDMESMAKAGDLEYKFEKLADDTAVALTELEMKYGKSMGDAFEENKDEVTEVDK